MKLRQLTRKKILEVIGGRLKSLIEENTFSRISSTYDINGFKRVYFLHIRKAGGTSLNNMFLSISGEDSGLLYTKLAKTLGHRILTNRLIYVGWNVRLINKGHYFYGFSHSPLHKLDLPEGTFTVTCFRDPVKRVLSHYCMLMDFQVNNVQHPCMATEGRWLGKNFNDFLQNIPKEHLLNQLYMFSKDFYIDEAVRNVHTLSCYFFTEAFEMGINELNSKSGLSLEAVHIRKANYRAQISDESLVMLRDMLDDEYRFLERIRKL